MSVFREFDSYGRDRATEDRRRHRELVDDAIKKNIGHIIGEESIIGQSKNKKVKIPIRGIKEYQFIYGKNQPGVGAGTGEEKRGDKIGSDEMQKQDGKEGAGNREGEDIYETEVSIEDLIQYLFEDLDLPYMQRKKFNEIESEKEFKKRGYQRKGIRPRLAKKRSVVEKIKRKKIYERGKRQLKENDGVLDIQQSERFPFKEDDLRYYRMRKDVRRESNAVILCIMDTSGSMDITKKYLARSFYFLLYQFVRLKYVNVEVVFISHSTTAKEVSEDDFFHRGQSGGTYISSGYQKALDIIEDRYNPEIWNIYAFHCSDGDNWTEDNENAVKCAKMLCEKCNLFGYGEILLRYYTPISTMREHFATHVKERNFSIVTMSKKEDVIPALKKLLDKEKELGEL